MLGNNNNALMNNQNRDFPVQNSPDDTVSSLTFSPVSNLLVGGGWSKDVCVWDIQANGSSIPKAKISHNQPVLCTDWSHDGMRVFSGGCDNLVKCWDLGSNQQMQVATHGSAVKSVFWIKNLNLLVTGSWDKTIKYWDLRQQQPTATIQLSERVYCMDVKHPVLVVGTAPENKKSQIHIFNLDQPHKPYRSIESPLKFQSRCVSIFPDTVSAYIRMLSLFLFVHSFFVFT
jgi:mRNA export factor